MIKICEFKGRIRNWKSLCKELKIDPILKRDELENKILIEAYKKWKYDMGNHINGMFAFALWDDDEKQLMCMRDQFGTKPFYYYLTEDKNLLYSSQISEITKQNGFVKELNNDMLQNYLTFTYAAGEGTFFKGIKKLLPGRYLVFKNGKIEINRYWKPEFKPDNSKTLEEWADEIHETVKQIMMEIKSPEEKAASFLSSGVDSSYVLAMSDVKDSVSCGYDNSPLDESHEALKTAEHLGKKGHVHIVTPEEYFECIPYVMKKMEQPLGDASAPAFALSCRAAAKIAPICYSGEGSDEFFAGYNMHKNAEKYGENLPDFYIGNTNIMKEEEKQRLLKNYNPDILPIDAVKNIHRETEGWSPLSRMLAVDIQIWLEGDIYLNVDKMGTAAGLDIRMPLTDIRIFDIASHIPDKFKIDGEINKAALRTAAAKVLPEEVAFRKKLGFVVPIRKWLADSQYNADVVKCLHSKNAEKFFNIEEIDAIFNEYTGGNSDLWRKVWVIYAFLVWYDEFFEKC